MRRAVARSRLGRGRLILAGTAGTAGIAVCAALAVAALLPGTGTGSSTGQARLAAWTVTKQPDGA